MKNLSDLNKQIHKLKDKSLTVIINHSLGYHGSDKDRCNCGLSGVSESKECPQRTESTRKHLRSKVEALEKLFLVLNKLDDEDKKTILPFIDNDTIY